MISQTTDPSWLHGFRPFTLHHLIAASVAFTFAGLVMWRARRLRGTPGERRIRVAWGVVTAAAAVLVTVIWLQPARYRPDTAWPLHLCDLSAFLTPYALLSGRRWPKTLLFYWGLGLSSQGFLTPTISEGPADPIYWLFWIQHLGVVGGGLYLAVVNGFRPRWADLALAITATILLGLALVVFNVAFDTNYMYTGAMLPESRTIIDALGPWPLRLLWLGLLAALALTLTHLIALAVLRVSAGRGPG